MTAPANTELRETILHKLLGEQIDSEECYVDTKAKFVIDDVIELFQAHQQELLSELLGELPEKIEEGDGWDIYFTSGKEKGKVRSCCPGDDIAYVQNKTIDQVAKVIQSKIGELNG